MNPATDRIQIQKWSKISSPDSKLQTESDEVAVEEPLEIQVLQNDRNHKALVSRTRIAVTMRSPGHDLELAVGFLFNESILKSADDILGSQSGPNRVEVALSSGCGFDPDRVQRRFHVSSSCGVCGKSTIDQVWEQVRHCDRSGPGSAPFVSAELIAALPDRLREEQKGFARTGGLHASGLFAASGELLLIREDVGRHNALDKVIGRAVLDRLLPLEQTILALSGRVSFELMQKAAMAGIRVIVAVGAPSSLAVQLAQEFDLTLIGFIRQNRFSIYHGDWRVLEAADIQRTFNGPTLDKALSLQPADDTSALDPSSEN